MDDALQATAHWFLRHQTKDHSLPYQYMPISDTFVEGKKNRPVLLRLLFSIAAMGDIAKHTGSLDLRAAGARALTAYLDRHYHEELDAQIGYIQEGKRIPLGNAAATLIAILRVNGLKTHGAVAKRLAAFLLYMRREDGSYTPYHGDPQRRTNEEYFSGEAQLALLEWMMATGDKSALPAVLASARFYQRYYLARRVAPMVPWHTQANWLLFRLTRDRAIADFTLEMNDFIVTIQQRSSTLPEDQRGRFFNPAKWKTGFPHVSSTGVYLEGLADALALAQELNDTQRVKRYQRALAWGIRAVLQAQIRVPEDTWCMPNPELAEGGFRSRWDYPAVRIDNQQHCGIALAKAAALLSDRDLEAVRIEEKE
jgi:hypothetical protein